MTTVAMDRRLAFLVLFLCSLSSTECFHSQSFVHRGLLAGRKKNTNLVRSVGLWAQQQPNQYHHQQQDGKEDRMLNQQISDGNGKSRRQLIKSILGTVAASSLAATSLVGQSAQASVGTLYELSNTTTFLQGVTIDVADVSQLDQMTAFLRDGLGMSISHTQQIGPVSEVWMSYGPEELQLPSNFVFPVSSFGQYGGHASIRLRYDASLGEIIFRPGDTTAPGNNIAYLQVGVPEYRISKLYGNGGYIFDAYGFVNALSPSGVPFRAIVGIVPDPIMFVGIYTNKMEDSKAYYKKALGLVERPFPFARQSKGTGPFEPPQPPKSVFLGPPAVDGQENCGMGILLLPPKKRNDKITPNPAFRSLNVLYNEEQQSIQDETFGTVDPSGVQTKYQSVGQFTKLEKALRFTGAAA